MSASCMPAGLAFCMVSHPSGSPFLAWDSHGIVVSGKMRVLHGDGLSRGKKWNLPGRLRPLSGISSTSAVFSGSEQSQSLPRFKGGEKDSLHPNA